MREREQVMRLSSWSLIGWQLVFSLKGAVHTALVLKSHAAAACAGAVHSRSAENKPSVLKSP